VSLEKTETVRHHCISTHLKRESLTDGPVTWCLSYHNTECQAEDEENEVVADHFAQKWSDVARAVCQTCPSGRVDEGTLGQLPVLSMEHSHLSNGAISYLSASFDRKRPTSPPDKNRHCRKSYLWPVARVHALDQD
jgi:hypothetical protein